MQRSSPHLLLAGCALTLLAGLLVVSFSSAQNPPESAAIALEKDVNAAVLKLGPVSYRARTWESAGEMRATGTVEVMAGSPHGVAGMPLWPLLVRWDPKQKGEPTVLAAFDGKRLLQQMPEEKEVWDQILTPDGGISMLPIFDATLPGLGQPEVFPTDDAVRTRGEPIQVGEHRCDVLVATRSQAASTDPDTGKAMTTRFRMEVAVDTQSRIPLRGEFIITMESEGRTTELRHGIELVGDLHALATEPQDFSVPVPEGWRLVDANPEEDAPLLSTGDIAPDWTLADFGGREHRLSELRGRVVLLDFWATWCGPCKQAMPELQKLHQRFESRGLTVIGISQRENEEGHESEKGGPASYFLKMKYTYLGLVKGEKTGEAYGVRGIPHMFLIGRDGKLVAQHVGFSPELGKTLADEIEKLLGK